MSGTKYLNVKFDFYKVLKGLNNLEREQFPFVLAKTLTQSAKRGQGAGQQATRDAFKLHTEWIPRNIKIEGANKSDIKAGRKMQARVFTQTGKKGIGFMVDHETGGTKTPLGTALTPPQEGGLKEPGFKTGTGKVASKWQPAKLLRHVFDIKTRKRVKGRNERGKRVGTGGNPAFISRGRIVRRADNTKEGRKKLIVIYRFIPRGKIKPVWKFGDSVEQAVVPTFEQLFWQNMNDAVIDRAFGYGIAYG